MVFSVGYVSMLNGLLAIKGMRQPVALHLECDIVSLRSTYGLLRKPLVWFFSVLFLFFTLQEVGKTLC